MPKTPVKRAPKARIPKAQLSPIEMVSLDQMEPDPVNARMHGKKNLTGITDSFTEFGQLAVILLQKGTGRIIAGEGRWKSLKALGVKSAEARFWDVDDKTARRASVALNRTGDTSDWDETKLDKIIAEATEDDNIVPGYSSEDVDAILNSAEVEENMTRGGDPNYDLAMYEESRLKELEDLKTRSMGVEEKLQEQEDQQAEADAEANRKTEELKCPKCGHKFTRKI